MPQRLNQRFAQNQSVEIRFRPQDEWLPAVVIRFDPPGMWVRTADGRPWFVTNGRRVRAKTAVSNDNSGGKQQHE